MSVTYMMTDLSVKKINTSAHGVSLKVRQSPTGSRARRKQRYEYKNFSFN